tara:strand:+ start:1507 stop:2214 length:708 start_codon:yes stop_codon:yes gene_type:complete
MEFYIVLVIIVTAVIQSIFGVGVLLFGTPLLLIGGYDFVNALTVLLPISLVINLFQIVKGQKLIDLQFYRKLLIYSIPLIVLLLVFTVTLNIDVSFFIGAFLLFISLKPLSETVEKIIAFLFSFDRTYFVVQGIIHGVTNLGGSLLTSKVFSMDIGKAEKRATISLSYFTFALFQILTLVAMGKLVEFNFSYLFVGAIVFALTDFFIYDSISTQKYDNLFAVFLFISGCALIFMR